MGANGGCGRAGKFGNGAVDLRQIIGMSELISVLWIVLLENEQKREQNWSCCEMECASVCLLVREI